MRRPSILSVFDLSQRGGRQMPPAGGLRVWPRATSEMGTGQWLRLPVFLFERPFQIQAQDRLAKENS